MEHVPTCNQPKGRWNIKATRPNLLPRIKVIMSPANPTLAIPGVRVLKKKKKTKKLSHWPGSRLREKLRNRKLDQPTSTLQKGQRPNSDPWKKNQGTSSYKRSPVLPNVVFPMCPTCKHYQPPKVSSKSNWKPIGQCIKPKTRGSNKLSLSSLGGSKRPSWGL